MPDNPAAAAAVNFWGIWWAQARYGLLEAKDREGRDRRTPRDMLAIAGLYNMIAGLEIPGPNDRLKEDI